MVQRRYQMPPVSATLRVATNDRRRPTDWQRAGEPETMSQTQDLTRVHLWISGRVQGVFFRATTSAEARARGLTGWVRNAPDGRVEAEVQGTPDAVDDLIDECRSGPSLAKVTDIVVEPIDVVSGEERFQIVH